MFPLRVTNVILQQPQGVWYCTCFVASQHAALGLWAVSAARSVLTAAPDVQLTAAPDVNAQVLVAFRCPLHLPSSAAGIQ